MGPPETVERAVRFLEARGAASLAHPGGTLLAHLLRTHRQLLAWDASEDLALAGLCHAAYGTDGFPHPLLPRSERHRLVHLIGPTAERLVYAYGSCDRSFLYPQLGTRALPESRDRFTGATTALPDRELRDLVELTFANELDLVAESPLLAAEHGPTIAELFGRCEALVSPAAFAHFRQLLPAG